MKAMAIIVSIVATLSFVATITFFVLAIWCGDTRFSMMGTLGVFVTIITGLGAAISWVAVSDQ
jgi:EamA domain-containing membrane protein RarD